LAGRHGREDADAEYWLTLIASFVPDSPVILVLNKINEHRFEINRRALQRKFPNIRQVVKTDCLDRTGLASLHRAIRSETDGLPNLRDKFPVEWFSIKNRLSTMDENYLTFERYRALCAENGEPIRGSQELVAGYLHSLGMS
jgi:internalin A